MMIGYAIGELCKEILKNKCKSIKKIIIFQGVGIAVEKINFGYIFHQQDEDFKMNIISYQILILCNMTLKK